MRLKTLKVVLVSLVLAALVPAANAKTSDKLSVLRSCTELFGVPVVPKRNLFEVSRFYFLRVQFDDNGKLKELAVEPKYFFQEHNSDWVEPPDFAFLSKAEYEGILGRLDNIKRRGRLIRSSSAISFVTNMTAHHQDVYENAVLSWGELVDARRGQNPPLQVRWLRLDYSRRAR